MADTLWCEGDGRGELKIESETSLHYFLSVLLYYKSNFRQTDYLHSRTPLCTCVARTRILLAMFGSQILSGSGEMSKRHLVESSDRWNNMFTSIPSAISMWMLEEMSRIGMKIKNRELKNWGFHRIQVISNFYFQSPTFEVNKHLFKQLLRRKMSWTVPKKTALEHI